MKSSREARHGRPEAYSNARFYGLIAFTLAIFILLPFHGFGQGFSDPFTLNTGQTPAPPTLTPNTPAPVQTPVPSVQVPQPAPAAAKPPTAAAAAPLGAPPPSVPPMATDFANKKPVPQKPGSQPPVPGMQTPVGAEVPPTMTRTSLRDVSRNRHVAAATPSGEPSESQLKENPKLIQSVPTPGHPMIGYLELPVDSQSMIRGRALPIAELLNGVRNTNSRRPLVQAYWELVGSLAEYNCRLQAEQQAAGGTRDAQLNQTVNLLRQQRRATEIDFVKKQWQLAELVRRHKGVPLSEESLPIPNEYPLIKKYDTHADRIARSERSRYVGRMIPIQEQLVQARLLGCRETFELHKTIPPNSQQLLLMLNQRTEAFLAMTDAIVEYNQMIAEYAAETIPAGVSRYQFVSALVELPKFEPSPTQPGNRPNQQMAAPPAPKLSAVPNPQPEAPESAYAAPLQAVADHVQPPMPPEVVAKNTPPARPFDSRNADPMNRQNPLRRGHPDITQAAFESAVVTEPSNEPIAQASHVEAAPEIPAEVPTEPTPPQTPPSPPSKPKTLPKPPIPQE